MHERRHVIQDIRNDQAIRVESQVRLDAVTEELKCSTAEALARSRDILRRTGKYTEVNKAN
jgi:hypothetical protein